MMRACRFWRDRAPGIHQSVEFRDLRAVANSHRGHFDDPVRLDVLPRGLQVDCRVVAEGVGELAGRDELQRLEQAEGDSERGTLVTADDQVALRVRTRDGEPAHPGAGEHPGERYLCSP